VDPRKPVVGAVVPSASEEREKEVEVVVECRIEQ